MKTTNVFRRQTLRAAVKIHEHLRGSARHSFGLALPQSAWEELGRTIKHLKFAEHKRWQAAARSLIQDLDYTALRVQREMEILRQRLGLQNQVGDVATPGVIAEQLIALENEFDGVTLDLKQQCVSVLTPAIELEGVQLV